MGRCGPAKATEIVLKAGLAKSDITPRIGVELSGFGPFIHRYAVAVRDRLWARALALEQDGVRLLLISCDLIGVTPDITARVRSLLFEAAGLAREAVMLHCTHTHSGPATGGHIGWGEPDPPYLETLPDRIARAGTDALDRLSDAELRHAEVPCRGIGLNREYDRDAPPLPEVLDPGWTPARPERTDTTCHVLSIFWGGSLRGFAGYFGCHPVVCKPSWRPRCWNSNETSRNKAPRNGARSTTPRSESGKPMRLRKQTAQTVRAAVFRSAPRRAAPQIPAQTARARPPAGRLRLR